MLFALPLLAIAICVYLGWLAWRRPMVLLQNFHQARWVALAVFGAAFAFSLGVRITYHALLPYLDVQEVKQAAVSMGWLNVMDPEWIGTAGLIVLLVMYAMHALAQEIGGREEAGCANH